MRKTFFFASILVSSLSIAALPPLSDDERESMATDIVEGVVNSVEQTVSDAGSTPGRHDYKNWDVTAKIKLTRIVKSSKSGGLARTITVKYWKSARRPTGFAGPQGQNQHLYQQARVKLFLKATHPENHEFELLAPNGWEYATDQEPGTEPRSRNMT